MNYGKEPIKTVGFVHNVLYLLSGAVRSGKTTLLHDVFKKRPDVYGILAPVRQKERHMCLLPGDTCRNLHRDVTPENAIAVGRYRFHGEVFAWARTHLMRFSGGYTFFVVDETGPLELQGGGLEPALSAAVEKARLAGSYVILVVRERLCRTAAEFYGQRFSRVEIITAESLRGLSPE